PLRPSRPSRPPAAAAWGRLFWFPGRATSATTGRCLLSPHQNSRLLRKSQGPRIPTGDASWSVVFAWGLSGPGMGAAKGIATTQLYPHYGARPRPLLAVRPDGCPAYEWTE